VAGEALEDRSGCRDLMRIVSLYNTPLLIPNHRSNNTLPSSFYPFQLRLKHDYPKRDRADNQDVSISVP
jgi:hypothetical protein